MGGGDAARAERFAWLLANPGIGREENQQLRDGSLLPARTLQARIRRREEGRLGLLALKRLDQFQTVEVCVVDEQPHLVVRELLRWHAGVGNRLHLMRVRELAVKPRGMDVLRQHHGRAIVDPSEGPGCVRREDRAGAELFSCTVALDGVAFLPGTDAPPRPVDRYESMMDVRP